MVQWHNQQEKVSKEEHILNGQSDLGNMQSGDFYRGDGGNYFHDDRNLGRLTVGKIQNVSPSAAAPGGGVVKGNPQRTSGFRTAKRPDHNGVDIAAPPGTPLTAVADGVIVEEFSEGGGRKGWGHGVVYRVGGEYHLYGHLSKHKGFK